MLPLEPKIPSGPVPIHLDGLVALQQKSLFWARLATLVSVLTAFTFLLLALFGEVRWLIALPFFLFPLVPIAAETRIAEIKRVIDRQLLDRLRVPDDEDGAPDEPTTSG